MHHSLPGKKFIPAVKHGGESIMLWDVIFSAAGPGRAVRKNWEMNAAMYRDILDDDLLQQPAASPSISSIKYTRNNFSPSLDRSHKHKLLTVDNKMENSHQDFTPDRLELVFARITCFHLNNSQRSSVVVNKKPVFENLPVVIFHLFAPHYGGDSHVWGFSSKGPHTLSIGQSFSCLQCDICFLSCFQNALFLSCPYVTEQC